MNKLAVLILAFSLYGCATVHTVSNADNGVEIRGSHCDEIHHVMSGTSYNICKMYGEPGDIDGIHTRDNLVWLAIDSVASFAADIVLLPVTVFRQLNGQPIEVNPEIVKQGIGS